MYKCVHLVAKLPLPQSTVATGPVCLCLHTEYTASCVHAYEFHSEARCDTKSCNP